MAKMNYSEKLKDPRWQKKRLEVLQRENFTCESCQSTTNTLHVHHKTYVFGNDPWDYPDTNFSVLCDFCHEYEEYYKEEVKGIIHDLLIMGFDSKSIYEQLLKLHSE